MILVIDKLHYPIITDVYTCRQYDTTCINIGGLLTYVISVHDVEDLILRALKSPFISPVMLHLNKYINKSSSMRQTL